MLNSSNFCAKTKNEMDLPTIDVLWESSKRVEKNEGEEKMGGREKQQHLKEEGILTEF